MKLSSDTARVLVIPDLQIPYEHPDALRFMQAVKRKLKPTDVVCIGDEVDQHRMARFDPDPEAPGAGDELREAKSRLRKWYRSFPDVMVCMSNHTARIYKKAFHAGIPEAYLRPINEWLGAPDTWRWADHWEIDGVRYEHGDAQGGMYAARNLALRNRQSTVIGHHHSHGGVWYMANHTEMLFALNVGCLIDPNSLAFKYAKHSAFKPTLGCGVVNEGIPSFIPMVIDQFGRWRGYV